MTATETLDWIRSEIRRLDKQCRQATTPRGEWYCLGKRAGLRTVLILLTHGREDGRNPHEHH